MKLHSTCYVKTCNHVMLYDDFFLQETLLFQEFLCKRDMEMQRFGNVFRRRRLHVNAAVVSYHRASKELSFDTNLKAIDNKMVILGLLQVNESIFLEKREVTTSK